MLGLGYPGGPAISKCAKDGDPTAFQLPRSFIKEQDRLQFSFSGLKTAVRYKIAGPGKPIPTEIGMSDSEIADLCASFEQAVVDLVMMFERVADQTIGAASFRWLHLRLVALLAPSAGTKLATTLQLPSLPNPAARRTGN